MQGLSVASWPKLVWFCGRQQLQPHAVTLILSKEYASTLVGTPAKTNPDGWEPQLRPKTIIGDNMTHIGEMTVETKIKSPQNTRISVLEMFKRIIKKTKTERSRFPPLPPTTPTIGLPPNPLLSPQNYTPCCQPPCSSPCPPPKPKYASTEASSPCPPPCPPPCPSKCPPPCPPPCPPKSSPQCPPSCPPKSPPPCPPPSTPKCPPPCPPPSTPPCPPPKPKCASTQPLGNKSSSSSSSPSQSPPGCPPKPKCASTQPLGNKSPPSSSSPSQALPSSPSPPQSPPGSPPCPPKCPTPTSPICCKPAQCTTPWPAMLGLLFEPTSKKLSCCCLPAPTTITKDEVLVQVAFSTVCGSDMSMMAGKLPSKTGPVVLGHEFGGIACAVGTCVSHVQCGDSVAVDPYHACNTCRACTTGQYGGCPCEGLHDAVGSFKNGGWAEFCVVNKTQVHKLPPSVSLDRAPMVQPLSCILSAMSRLNIQPGMDILIQGVGSCGALWASLLHHQGHRGVAVTDKEEKKLKCFEKLNTEFCMLPVQKIPELKVDLVIDATGSTESLERAVKILRNNGQLCIFGIANPTETFQLSPYDASLKELKIIGCAMNTFCFSQAVSLVEAMGGRYLDYNKLTYQVYDMSDFEEAFKSKSNGDINKVVFKIC